MKKTISNKDKLTRLNKLFKSLTFNWEQQGEKYKKAMNGDEASREVLPSIAEGIRDLSEQFDALRRDMPRVKFDMAAGKYFYADAGHGEEMFAIKVKRNDCFYVTLPAKSAGEAMDRAKQIVAEQNGVPLVFLDAEDYSR